MEIYSNPVSDFDAAVRALSGGTNVAIYNDMGMPSIYVRRDKGSLGQYMNVPDTIHYAFKVNGVEVPAFYMGKYLATVYKGRALSLPLQDPTAYSVAVEDRGAAIGKYVDFNNAKIWCEANGAGFHLPTIAEYAWIALMSLTFDTMPRGNNSYGSNAGAKYEKSIGALCDANGDINRTLTGSGPATWNDNWQPDGICDLNGNVYEWQGGYRTVDGELQIFPDNDAAMHADQSESSPLWKAIMPDGTLVDPGTPGTLKWDYTADPGTSSKGRTYRLNTTLEYQQSVEAPYGNVSFANLKAAPGVSVPYILKELALMPEKSISEQIPELYQNNAVYMKNIDERFTQRGGMWKTGNVSGVFFAMGNSKRTAQGTTMGFRPAFIPGI